MAPAAPAKCGVKGCPGDATRTALVCKCDVATHHKAHLVQDSSGLVTWAWASRGPSQLVKAGLTILKSDPADGGPRAVEPALQPVAADEVANPVVSPHHADPQTPEQPKCSKAALGFSDQKVHGRINFGPSRRILDQCVVCSTARDSCFRGRLGVLGCQAAKGFWGHKIA